MGTGAPITVSVGQLSTGNCNGNSLNMAVYFKGKLLNVDESSTSCPSVTFQSTLGLPYVLVIMGQDLAISSWVLTVS